MTRAWVALGANLGRPRHQIEVALAALAADARVSALAVSTLIETEPVGGPSGQPRFLNGVARLEFDGTARELLGLLQALEQAAGRVREVPDGPRTLDLDLLLFGDERHRTRELTVPHPRLEQRAFVLVPLAELDPDLVLPGSGRRAAEQAARVAGRDPAAAAPGPDGGW